MGNNNHGLPTIAIEIPETNPWDTVAEVVQIVKMYEHYKNGVEHVTPQMVLQDVEETSDFMHYMNRQLESPTMTEFLRSHSLRWAEKVKKEEGSQNA